MFTPSFIDLSTLDHWYDLGFQHSMVTLQRFSDEEWADLLASWRGQPVEWQDRLAYILGDGEAASECKLLLEMYRCAPQEVRLTAAENLRSIALGVVVNALPVGDAIRLKTELGEPLDINAILMWVAKQTAEAKPV